MGLRCSTTALPIRRPAYDRIAFSAWQGLQGASGRPKALIQSALSKKSHSLIDETVSMRTSLAFKLPKLILHRVSKTRAKNRHLKLEGTIVGMSC